MKKSLLGLTVICLLSLIGCKSQVFAPSLVHEDLTIENWMQQINTSPDVWARQADSWYFTGQPNRMEMYARKAPAEKAISLMSVNAPYFTQIKLDGDFQVQIVGHQQQGKVFFAGTNADIRQIVTEVQGNLLYIHALPGANVKRVIVRIGVRDLRSLTNLGCATILGRNVESSHLVVTNCKSGRIILNGPMNVDKIEQLGPGTITLIGVCSPCLNIKVALGGQVNVSGRVGVQSIIATGGCVNIIGADSDSLKINASSTSTIKIAGYANLKSLTASDNSCVYLYWTCSKNLTITQSGRAKVGLAGSVDNININTTGVAFFGGQYLRAHNVYVKTTGASHANILTDQKFFAVATHNSSIYFYGSPTMVSRYNSENGLIVPIWSKT